MDSIEDRVIAALLELAAEHRRRCLPLPADLYAALKHRGICVDNTHTTLRTEKESEHGE